MNTSKHQPTTIAAFNPEWRSAYATYRIISPLRAADIELIQLTPTDSVDRIRHADVVLIGQEFPGEAPEAYQFLKRRAAELRKQVVYDISEPLFAFDRSHASFERYKSKRLAVLRAICEADAVIASTEVLAQEIKNFNAQVLNIATYLDGEIWNDQLLAIESDTTSDEEEKQITIGYIGPDSDQSDLISVENVLRDMLVKYSGQVILKLWGTQPTAFLKDLSNVRYMGNYPTDYLPFAKYFASRKPDFFISPIAPSRFNAGISPIRYLEQSFLGVPGIYGGTGPYEQLIAPGIDGIIAIDHVQWQKSIESFIKIADFRKRIGTAAQKKVRNSFMMNDYGSLIQAAWQPLMMFRNASNQARQRLGALQVIDAYAQYVSEMDADKGKLEGIAGQLRSELASAQFKLTSQVNSLKTHVQLEQDLRLATEDRNEELLARIAELETELQNASQPKSSWKVSKLFKESVRPFGA